LGGKGLGAWVGGLGCVPGAAGREGGCCFWRAQAVTLAAEPWDEFILPHGWMKRSAAKPAWGLENALRGEEGDLGPSPV